MEGRGKVREKLRTDEQQERDVQFWFFPHFATLIVCQYFVTITRQGRAARWWRDRTGWESALIQASAMLTSTWDTSSKSCICLCPAYQGNGNDYICLLVQRLSKSRGGKSCVTVGESCSLKPKRPRGFLPLAVPRVHQMISVRSQSIPFLKDFSDKGFIPSFAAGCETQLVSKWKLLNYSTATPIIVFVFLFAVIYSFPPSV